MRERERERESYNTSSSIIMFLTWTIRVLLLHYYIIHHVLFEKIYVTDIVLLEMVHS